MVEMESVPPNHNSLVPPAKSGSSPTQPPPPTHGGRGGLLSIIPRPPITVTSEFDSNSSIFSHKISCKFVENLAKLKLSFQNNNKGEVLEPQLSFTSKHLSLHYDLQEHNAFLKGFFELAPGLQLRAAHDVEAKQGELAMVADLAGPAYKLELSAAVPPVGLDEQMTFSPSISLPSNALLFAFKRRFGPSDKLSYLYNFDSNYWSAVYKHIVGKNYKLKAGYDSEVRLGWASLWVGNETEKMKTALMKMKVQVMLQVPQGDIRSSVLMLRVKKRWDI